MFADLALPRPARQHSLRWPSRCAIAVPPSVSLCADCLRSPPPFDAAVAAVDDAVPWADVVASFKVAQGLDRAEALAALLARRLVETPHVADLPRDARVAAVRGAFTVAPRRSSGVRWQRIALVDDVMTTGATLAEAARALRHAGAAEVHAWVLARTPAPSDA